MRNLFADLTPLRVSAPYRRMWFGSVLSGVGTALTTVAVGLQVYDLTGSTFNVGLVGLFALVPLIALGLYGGSIVDAHDRRRVMMTTSSGLFLVACAFAAQAWLGIGNVWLMYALVAVQHGLFAVNQPARGSAVPRLLPADLLSAANALNSLAWNVSLTVGPLLAGLLVSWWGYGGAYSVEAVLLLFAFASVVSLPPLPPEGRPPRAGLRSVLEGLRFLRTQPDVRMTFQVDLAAMVLAMPKVLFPAVGVTLIGGGAATVGVLAAAIAVGSIVAGVLSGPLHRVRRQGLAVLVSVVGWGLAVAGFGLMLAVSPGPGPHGQASWALWSAAGFLALAGAADAVSAVFRTTILQVVTPDALRGRLQGVFLVVVAGGPQLGGLLLGAVARWGGETVAAIGGGVACVLVVLALGVLQPTFVRYDARRAAAVRAG
ncbi:MFS transporter [Longispora fulva]|uniref:ENTS family enterobactin (Siderophore) exporter n=1 Tax=Longispora fulva TaxID=619741 RepID=A0A8J7KF21_9ACTN|nr:MFS transporter [Longispora fulva]MBG6135630.1 ENTS family enterobactin (siderophore) exporter [Longispora fulva]